MKSFFHVLLAPKRTKRPGTRGTAVGLFFAHKSQATFLGQKTLDIQCCPLNCAVYGAGFVLKLPVLIISKTKIARHKKTNSPSSKGEWLKAEGVKTYLEGTRSFVFNFKPRWNYILQLQRVCYPQWLHREFKKSTIFQFHFKNKH